ncbi:oligosaccharide flippase family protein [Candidatus Woesearchaeota archaeon]|nr:oligosaccharide flippase family protein [Candidatus Woesearchaeota archaeon]
MTKEATHMSALKQVLYGAGITFILGMMGYVLMFFFKLFAARYFGPEDFGIFEILMTILGLAVVFADMGIGFGVQRYISYYISQKKFRELKGYRIFAIGWPLVVSIVVSAILFLLAQGIGEIFNLPSEFSFLLKILVIAIPFRTINSFFTYYFFSTNNPFKAVFSYNVLERIILLATIGIIILLNLELIFMVVGLVFSISLSFLLYLLFYIKDYKRIISKPIFKTKEWLFFSLPLMLMGLMAYVLSWTDNFVLAGFIDSSAVGIYGIAYSLAAFLLFIPSLFGSLLMPTLTKTYYKSSADYKKIFSRTTIWVFGATIFGSVLLVLFSNQIIFILFGEEFLSGSMSLIILSVFFSIVNIFAFYYIPVLIKKKSKFLFYNNLMWAIFNLCLNLFFVNIFGIIGVALASGLSLLLLRISEYVYSQKLIMVKFEFGSVLKILFSGIISGVITKGVFLLFALTPIHLIAQLIIAGIIYSAFFVFLLFATKTFSQDDFDLMLVIEKKIGLDLSKPRKVLRKFL